MVTAGREPVRVDDAIARMRAVVAGPGPGDPGTADPELVRAALAGLNHDDQRLLWLKHVDTVDDQTIADRTGLPLGVVQRRLRQAERGLSAGFAAAHARAAAHASDACAATRQSLADYSRQRLPARARRVLEEHLYGCQDCMRAFIDVRQAGWALRDAAPLLLAGGAGLAAAGAAVGSMAAPVVGPAVVAASGASGGAGGLALVGATAGLGALRDGVRTVFHSGPRAALVVGGGVTGVVVAAGVAAALVLSGGPTGPSSAADDAGPASGTSGGAASVEEVSDVPTTTVPDPASAAPVPTDLASTDPSDLGSSSGASAPASVPADPAVIGSVPGTSDDAFVSTPGSTASDGGTADAADPSPEPAQSGTATPDAGIPSAEASPSAPVVVVPAPDGSAAPAATPTPTASAGPSATASPSPSVEPPVTTTSVVVTLPGACGAEHWQRYAVSLTAADGQTRLLTRDDATPASGLDGVWARPADDVRQVADGTWLLRTLACRAREVTFTLTTPAPAPATATLVPIESR